MVKNGYVNVGTYIGLEVIDVWTVLFDCDNSHDDQIFSDEASSDSEFEPILVIFFAIAEYLAFKSSFVLSLIVVNSTLELLEIDSFFFLLICQGFLDHSEFSDV
jgi:hypothetical protein